MTINEPIHFKQGFAGKWGVVVTLSHKVSIEYGSEQGVLKSQSSEDDTEEDEEFGKGRDPHSAIIVCCRW